MLFSIANYGCGHSELILGQALGDRRHMVVVATRFSFVVDEQAKAVEDSDDPVQRVREKCEQSQLPGPLASILVDVPLMLGIVSSSASEEARSLRLGFLAFSNELVKGEIAWYNRCPPWIKTLCEKRL